MVHVQGLGVRRVQCSRVVREVWGTNTPGCPPCPSSSAHYHIKRLWEVLFYIGTCWTFPPGCPFLGRPVSAFFFGSLIGDCCPMAVGSDSLGIQPFRNHVGLRACPLESRVAISKTKDKLRLHRSPVKPCPGLFLSSEYFNPVNLDGQNPFSTRFPHGKPSFFMYLGPGHIFSGKYNQYPFQILEEIVTYFYYRHI